MITVCNIMLIHLTYVARQVKKIVIGIKIKLHIVFTMFINIKNWDARLYGGQLISNTSQIECLVLFSFLFLTVTIYFSSKWELRRYLLASREAASSLSLPASAKIPIFMSYKNLPNCDSCWILTFEFLDHPQLIQQCNPEHLPCDFEIQWTFYLFTK